VRSSLEGKRPYPQIAEKDLIPLTQSAEEK
jgi:hypothetical protein